MLKYKDLIRTLTLGEKASLLSGATFWNTQAIERAGIPSIMVTDGPHGLRKQGGKADHLGLNASLPATCFPTAAALANSWDVTLVEEVGRLIGREAAHEGVSVVLGPGLDIVRNPLGGRNFEYYSEDPFLTGRLAAASVNGIQSNGIGASPKHFAVNSQEHMRMSIDEVVDERALREIHLEAFRHVVTEAQPRTIMTAYNKVNGQYANENTHLMQDILYKEWKFDGVAVTDWGGNNDRVAGLIAGNQLEMPTTHGITNREVTKAVEKGLLDESIIDKSVDDLLKLTFDTTDALKIPPKVKLGEHHRFAIEAARRSIVLLKNDNNILPLAPKTKIAVIGDFAVVPRYQGAGSSLVNPTQLETAYENLCDSSLSIVGYSQGYSRFGRRSSWLLHQSIREAKKADVVLLFLGLNEAAEAEGLDRPHMRLPANQLRLVNELTQIHKNVIVVLSGGSPIEMPFIRNVNAAIHSSLTGQGGGAAVVDVLTGASNPSGKLAVTYPLHYKDVPSASYFPGKELTAEHKESIFVGYRYYETANIPVLFPFGFGLSYTTFAYSGLTVKDNKVRFTITNTGAVAGEEVAQVYVRAKQSDIFRASKELKGFAKIYLAPGEARKVEVLLDKHAFAYFNVAINRWTTEPGEYEVQVGASIKNIQLAQVVTVAGEKAKNPYNSAALPSYYDAKVQHVSGTEFETLLGRKLTKATWPHRKQLRMDDTIAQLQYANWLGKAVYALLAGARKFLLLIRQPNTANNFMFVMNLPFNKIERLSAGRVSEAAVKKFLKKVSKL